MSNVECRKSAVRGRAGRRAGLDTRRSTLDTRRAAFTLIELLVVIGIIGIVVALGVPLFGVLTGSRSQEAGQNLVAAAIGQARTIAVNEGKYAGVLFYVDPATERTAMSLIIVADPASGLEDPDPYDKYKTWTNGQRYYAPNSFDTTLNGPRYGDRSIGLTSDATATFRNGPDTGVASTSKNVYDGPNDSTPGTTANVYSRLSEYVPNFKPSVQVYRARQDSSGSEAANENPPRNGPFGVSNKQYRRITPAAEGTFAGYGGPKGSSGGTFQNTYWSADRKEQVTPYATGGEQQLLPIGVGVQLIIQPTARADDTSGTPFAERYVRTGVIMFDPQGRLTLDPRQLGATATIAKYLGFTADAKELLAGVGVVFYDRTAFIAQPNFTEADWHYQNVAVNTTSAIVSPQAAFTDNAGQLAGTVAATEGLEETWLDSNTVPLLINRFSGALSEGQ